MTGLTSLGACEEDCPCHSPNLLVPCANLAFLGLETPHDVGHPSESLYQIPNSFHHKDMHRHQVQTLYSHIYKNGRLRLRWFGGHYSHGIHTLNYSLKYTPISWFAYIFICMSICFQVCLASNIYLTQSENGVGSPETGIT